jgi:hypothetical protein
MTSNPDKPLQIAENLPQAEPTERKLELPYRTKPNTLRLVLISFEYGF